MKTKPKVVKRKIKRKKTPTHFVAHGDEFSGVGLFKGKRKPLSKKQVKKNREEAEQISDNAPASSFRIDYYGNAIVHGDDGVIRLATVPKGTFMTMDLATALFAKYLELGRALTKEEVAQVIRQYRYENDPNGPQITLHPDDPEPDLQSQLNEIQTGEPALDIKVGFGKPFRPVLASDDPAWTPITLDTERALQADFESSKKRLEAPPLPPQLVGDDEWELFDGTRMRFNPETGRHEEIPTHGGTIIVAMIVLFCAFAGGFAAGYYAHKPRVEYKNQILYRNAAQTYDLRANPFENKIRLQPWQIEIIEGR